MQHPLLWRYLDAVEAVAKWSAAVERTAGTADISEIDRRLTAVCQRYGGVIDLAWMRFRLFRRRILNESEE